MGGLRHRGWTPCGVGRNPLNLDAGVKRTLGACWEFACGQLDDERRAAAGGLRDADPAVVRRDDRGDDGQAQAVAAARAARCGRGRRGRTARTPGGPSPGRCPAPWSRTSSARAAGVAGGRRRSRSGVPAGVWLSGVGRRGWSAPGAAGARRPAPRSAPSGPSRPTSGDRAGPGSMARASWAASAASTARSTGSTRSGRSSSSRASSEQVLDEAAHPGGLALDPAHRAGDVVRLAARRPGGTARRSRGPRPAGCAARARRRRRTGASAPRRPRARRTPARSGRASR